MKTISILILSVICVGMHAQQSMIEHNASIDDATLQLHEASDGPSILTFSNDQFANNRFIISADPSNTAGTNASMVFGWGNTTNPSSAARILTLDGATNGVAIDPTNMADQVGKLGVYSDSSPDLPQLTLVETGTVTDFTRFRFLNENNLFDANNELQHWTIAARIGDPNDYRFLVALNGDSRMRYLENTGEWEFFSDPSLNSRIIVDEIELNGSDFAEKFEVESTVDLVATPGFVVTINPDKAGALKIADQAYDKKVVGIISGANGINPGMLMGQDGTIANGDYPVALSGRVYVASTDINGKIQPGDMLTTSEIAGHAMKATKKKQSYGSVIGKAMTSPDENGFVLVLVNLQ